MTELVVLLYHLMLFEDLGADETKEELIKAVPEYLVRVDKRFLEAAFYASNMMDEDGKFWHPLGITFDEFTERTLQHRGTFDKYYNLIKENKNG